MDQNLLVESGHKLVDALQEKGVDLAAALWVHNADRGTWRLWLVPRQQADKRAFYRQVAEVIAQDYTGFHGIEASDTEMVSVEHPAIRGLRGFAPVEGLGAVHISSNMLNGYYMQDGIILRMAL